MLNSEKTPLFNLIPESVDNAVKNISDPPTKGVGQTLADIWYLVIGGSLHHLADKRSLKYAHCLDQFQKELTEAVDKIPDEKRVEPDFQSVSCALENSKYCAEKETLRKLFTGLITSSMNSDKSKFVHPAFGEIIKQMQPLDAILFNHLYWKYRQQHIPMIHPQIMIVGTNRYLTRATPQWFCGVCKEGYTMFDISISLVNLNRLGLIELFYDRTIFDTNILYAKVKESPLLAQVLAEQQVSHSKHQLELAFTDCAGSITEFGTDFANACLPLEGFSNG